jgi:hypothetical protein
MERNSAMKTTEKRLGKSSTKVASLSSAITNIKHEINPVPRATKCSSTPKPMRTTGQVWIKRKVRIVKSSSTSVNVSSSDVYAALTSFSVTGDSALVRVDGIKAWNITNSSVTSNYLSVAPQPVLFNLPSSGGTNSLTGPYEDYGAGGIPPSVSVNLPMSLTSTFTVVQGSTTVLVSSGVYPPGLSGSTSQNCVFDIYLAVAY